MPASTHPPVKVRLSRIISTLLIILVVVAVSASVASARTEYRGANVHSLQNWNETDAQATQDLDALKRAGANVARVDVTWSALEPAKSQYSADYLTRMDAFVTGAQARGIKLIATVAGTPTWASTDGKWNDAPSDPMDFGDIARYITNRYGTALAAVEAWNEPNWHNNLIAADVPATYAAMLKAFYTGAKQGNPNVDVLAGATAYTDPAFFTALWAHGIKGYYDGISIHPYADGAAPSDTTVTHSFIGAITAMHATQTANGDNTPLWITEFGWPTGSWNGATSEQLSATYLQQAFAILDTRSYVKGATAYQLRDQGTDTTNPEDNFGLMHQDLTPRPAYAAFTAAMHATDTPSAAAASQHAAAAKLLVRRVVRAHIATGHRASRRHHTARRRHHRRTGRHQLRARHRP